MLCCLSGWYRSVPGIESPDGSNANPQINSNGQSYGYFLERKTTVVGSSPCGNETHNRFYKISLGSLWPFGNWGKYLPLVS